MYGCPHRPIHNKALKASLGHIFVCVMRGALQLVGKQDRVNFRDITHCNTHKNFHEF